MVLRRIVDYLLRKETNLRERMCEEMGGKVLRLPSDELREAREDGLSQGVGQGIKTGKEEKTRVVVSNMLKRGISDSDICAMAECDLAFVEQVRKQLQN